MKNIARTNMIKQQCRPWDILNPAVLDLLEKIPRENFVPAHYAHLAYADTALPLGNGQFMLCPREEAKILDKLLLENNERVLEIGTGSGYFTALLASQAKHVDSIDIFQDFIKTAALKLQQQGIYNVLLETADGVLGCPKKQHHAYDAIIITASIAALPKHLFAQLNPGGRLFVFLGKPPIQQAVLITRPHPAYHTDNTFSFKTELLFQGFSVPLIHAPDHEKFTF